MTEIIHRLGDSSIDHIAEKCHNLESFSCTVSVAVQNIGSVFRNNGDSLRQVNLSCTHSLNKATMMGLLCSLPNLSTLRAHFCAWFDDEVLRAIYQTQKQRKLDRVGEFCLKTIGTVRSRVTISVLREFLLENATARLEIGRTRGSLGRALWLPSRRVASPRRRVSECNVRPSSSGKCLWIYVLPILVWRRSELSYLVALRQGKGDESLFVFVFWPNLPRA